MINGALKKKPKNQLLLSVIIPLYNGSKTIFRLLESIKNQEYLPENMEIIIQDDSSTDNGVDKIGNSEYYNMFNIKFFKNEDRKIHCPGNTRRDGLSHATGKWVTFIDQDDILETNAFKEVFDCINHNNEKKLVVSKFREYFVEEDVFGREFDQNAITWMHGKFYNREFLEAYNINFKEDLTSDEDLYFNQKVLSTIIIEGLNYSILNVPIYRWVINDESESRKMGEDGFTYIDKNYETYLQAASEPWLDLLEEHPDKTKDVCDKLISISIYAYFYYQSLFYRQGFRHVKKNRDVFEKYINMIRDKFGVNNQYMIDYVYSDYQRYNSIRKDAFFGAIEAIECESYISFLQRF